MMHALAPQVVMFFVPVRKSTGQYYFHSQCASCIRSVLRRKLGLDTGTLVPLPCACVVRSIGGSDPHPGAGYGGCPSPAGGAQKHCSRVSDSKVEPRSRARKILRIVQIWSKVKGI